MNKKVFVAAGAALAVAACGVFLSKGLREFLFDALSGEEKRGKRGSDRIADDVEIENIPGPSLGVELGDGDLAVCWHTRMAPMQFLHTLSAAGIDTSEGTVQAENMSPVLIGEYTLGREPSLARVRANETEYVIHTSMDVSEGLPYRVFVSANALEVEGIAALYQKTTGCPLSPGAAKRLKSLFATADRFFKRD